MAVDMDDKNIFVHWELLRSLDFSPMDLNDKKNPVRQRPLGFLIANSLEQTTSLPIIRETAAFDSKGELISARRTQMGQTNNKDCLATS